jgi:gamma-glutamyltranspeptidase/glutathione hydrolase
MPVPGTTLTSLRPLIQGRNGVVVASHPDAAMAGLEILKRGGNAIDAGVAVGLALNVLHSHECSFLGVAPMLLYLADRRDVVSIDGLGVWPKAMSLDYLQKHHQGKLPPGIMRTLTPGAADAWFTALAQYGTLRFGDVAQAAISLAGDGFPMYRFLASAIQNAPEVYGAAPGTAAVFLPGGRPPKVGEMFYQRDLAASLRALAAVEASHESQGRVKALQAARDVVYTGDIAKKIAAYCEAEGGLMTMEDIAAYHVRAEPPAKVNYRGYDVYCTGPATQGPVFPQMLKILEGFDLRAMGHNSAAYAHTVDQAMNLAFADREAYIGDPAFVDVPMEAMLSEAYLRERRKLIDPNRAWPGMPPAGDPAPQSRDRRRRAAIRRSGHCRGRHQRQGDVGYLVLRRHRQARQHLLLHPERRREVRANHPRDGARALVARLPGEDRTRACRRDRIGQAPAPDAVSRARSEGRRAGDGARRLWRRPHPAGECCRCSSTWSSSVWIRRKRSRRRASTPTASRHRKRRQLTTRA